jgi:hypothetical protein
MKTWLLLLGCLLALTSQAQTRREVYAWKDAQGVTHYSDYPQPGARKILLNGAPSTTTATPPATTPAGARPAATPGATEVVYDRLEIWSPENGANFFEPDSVISVRLRAEPELGPTDRLLTYLDGKLLPGENLMEHSLTNVERGAHSVTSVIVDRDGKELIRSAPVVFHMKLTTMNNPRNQGPAVRPPQPKQGG